MAVSRRIAIIASLSAAAILAAISAGSLLKFFRGEPAPHFTAPIHYYENPSIPLTFIKIKAVYFIPKDRQKDLFANWSVPLLEAFGEMDHFHILQFRSRSKISYELYSEPVIGESEGASYDAEGTSRGNPSAARKINEELSGRLAGFLKQEPGEFLVKLYLYEGVGASAVGKAVILSRDFLTQPAYALTRSSIIYHEFGHALGMPEGYDVETNVPSSPDIMGSGRFKPLSTTYISEETKAAMGLK